MRKAINGTLKILTISSVIVSMLLILVAYCTQYSIKEKSDLKSRTNILAQCLDGYDENSEINILTKMYDNVSDIRVTLISNNVYGFDHNADSYYYFNMRYCGFVCECKAFDEIYFRSD